MSKETYFGRASGLDRSHGAIADHTYAAPFPPSGTKERLDLASIPQISLYEHLHFEGGSATTTFDWKYVGDWWEDKVASVVVVSGTWELYEKRDYTGAKAVLGPGYYDDVTGKIGSMRARRS